MGFLLMGLLGLCIGVGLLWLIAHLPRRIFDGWHNEVVEFLDSSTLGDRHKQAIRTHFNSTLPSTPMTNLQAIWVILLSAFLPMLAMNQFDLTIKTVLSSAILWLLIALSMIDFRHQLLPDVLVVPLAIIGLVASIWGIFCPSDESIFGAVIGFGLLWTLNILHRLITGKDGMGLGDVKLLAALGACLGVLSLPIIIFIAAVLGVVAGLYHRHTTGQDRFAFGPYLAIGGAVVLLFGQGFLVKLLTWLH